MTQNLPPHLSTLALDEVRAGLMAPPSHLGACVACRDRLRLAEEDAQRTRDLPGYHPTLARLRVQPPRSRWFDRLRVAGAGLALTGLAAGVLLMLHPPPPVDRVKGGPSLVLLRNGEAPRGMAVHPGEQVRLSVGAAGHRYVLVVAVDAEGRAQQVWPRGQAVSGELPSGGVTVLEPGFEVTPGDFLLFAWVSDAPLSARAATETLEDALRLGRTPQQPLPPRELRPAPLWGEAAHAQLYVPVER